MEEHNKKTRISGWNWNSVECFLLSSRSVCMWSEKLWEVLIAGQEAQSSWPGTPGTLTIAQNAKNHTSPYYLSCHPSLSNLFLFFSNKFPGLFLYNTWAENTNKMFCLLFGVFFLHFSGRVIHLSMACCHEKIHRTHGVQAMSWDILYKHLETLPYLRGDSLQSLPPDFSHLGHNSWERDRSGHNSSTGKL